MRGRDKLLEEVDGAPCLTTMTRRALDTGCDVVVVVPDLAHPRAKAATGAQLIPSPDASLGMAHSIRAGIDALPDAITGVMILPGDMPDITTADMAGLAAAFETSDAAILQAATADGLPGHPVLFSAHLLPQFAALNGDQGARAIIEANRDKLQFFTLPGQRARLDLDTPEHWSAWRVNQAQPPES